MIFNSLLLLSSFHGLLLPSFSLALPRGFHISTLTTNAILHEVCQQKKAAAPRAWPRATSGRRAEDPKSPAAPRIGGLESPFRKLAPHPLSYPYLMTTSRPIPVNYFRVPQTPIRCAKISWGHMASESGSPVIAANLARNSTPLPKKGRGIGARAPSTDSTRVAAANYRRGPLFALCCWRCVNESPRSTGNKLIGERRLLIIVSNGVLAP